MSTSAGTHREVELELLDRLGTVELYPQRQQPLQQIVRILPVGNWRSTEILIQSAPQLGPALAKVTLPSGQTVTGRVRTMTDFELSLTDSSGAYHYWPRSQVKVEIEDKLTGHRDLLPKYSDADIHNLTAYLVTLK